MDEVAFDRLHRSVTPDVLHRERTEALAEEHELGPVLVAHAPQIAGDRMHERTILLDRQPRAGERHRRRQHRVLHRRDRAVAEGQVLERLSEHVVDVARPGGRCEHEYLALERPRTDELVHDEVDPVLDLGGRVEAHE